MKATRINSIDAFRGLAILGMVIANFIAGVDWIPAYLKHAKDVGFTVIDLVAPMFIFAIGLTYPLSARRRFAADGTWKASQHFITRFFAILGIGALLSAGEILFEIDGQTINWGVLQAIGAAGLVTFIFIRTPAWVRLAAGLLLLAVYQYVLDTFWLQSVLASPHGGLQGAISWSAMLLIATVFGDLFSKEAPRVRWVGLAALLDAAAALALTLWLPISKNRVSAPYVLLTLGLSGLIFALMHFCNQRLNWKVNLLCLWGKNPLLLYVLHMVLLGIMVLPGIPAWYSAAPWWLTLLQGLFVLGVLTWVAWGLDKRRKYVSL